MPNNHSVAHSEKEEIWRRRRNIKEELLIPAHKKDEEATKPWEIPQLWHSQLSLKTLGKLFNLNLNIPVL